jgi:ectoine hydroxylase-related dioxygenase (phytanoyl-CoA dioxygenase family)
VLEILNAMALEPGLRHLSVVEQCRSVASAILGVNRTSCLFDHVIYKNPGGQPVAWHQDLAGSRSGLFERAVHFWIPLHDLVPESGCMMFIAGSHLGAIRQHQSQNRVGGIQLEVPGVDQASSVTQTLQLGGFSIHTPRTLHSSAANESTEVRKAWIMQFGAGLPAAARDVTRRRVPVWLSRRLAI